MHIAYLTSEYPHERTRNGGGIGTSIKNLASSIIKQGHSVTVFVVGCDRDEIFNDGDISIIKIAHVTYKFATWLFYKCHVAKVINKHIALRSIDVIEVPDWTGISAFMNLKAPVIVKFHGSDTYFCNIEKRPQKLKNRLLETIALKKADAYISVSKYTKELTYKLFKLSSKKPCTVIHNGIDIKIFQPTFIDLDNKDISFNIIYFGTLIRKKGALELPHFFNQLVEKIPNTTLTLIGSDSYDIITKSKSTWDLMKPLFSDKALLNVKYLGKVPYSTMTKYISESDVCVFPSYAEAFPLSWLEAMAMAKPVVASNIGWGPEMITDGVDGFLIHPKDHNGYAEKLYELYSSPLVRANLGENARKRIEQQFTDEIIAKQNIDFYKKIVLSK